MAQWRRISLPIEEMWVHSLHQEDPWRRKWQSIPVFLPGKSHGQRNLVSYSPWGCKRAGHDLGTKQQNRQGMGRQCKRTEEYTVIPVITFQNIIVKEIR